MGNLKKDDAFYSSEERAARFEALFMKCVRTSVTKAGRPKKKGKEEMKIISRYVHGSADSTDTDVVYSVDTLPSLDVCKKFCSASPSENRNLMTVRDGIVTAVYKGTPDELNNSLLRTYSLHPQTDPLSVTRAVERNVPLKIVRSVRIMLSHLSRTSVRPQVKAALRGSWELRLNVIGIVDLASLDFSSSKASREDIFKILAFQIGQATGLISSPQKEFYTKAEIAGAFPVLRPFLYRDASAPAETLTSVLGKFVRDVRNIPFEEPADGIVRFIPYGTSVDLKTEQIVPLPEKKAII